MSLIIQQRAGAAQFDGTAGQGLVTMADVQGDMPEAGEFAMVVKSISYDSDGDAHDVLLVYGLEADLLVVGGRRQILRATTFYGGTLAVLNSFTLQCGQDGSVVPRQSGQAPADSWVIGFFTNGKTDDGTLTVHVYAEACTK